MKSKSQNVAIEFAPIEPSKNFLKYSPVPKQKQNVIPRFAVLYVQQDAIPENLQNENITVTVTIPQ